jgi:SnoaL-like domain
VLTVDDQLAIERLYAAYAHYIDSDRFDEWVALFAPDGVFVTSETYAGRAELAAFVRKRAELKETLPFRDAQHWNSNLLLEEDGGIVRGSCYVARFAVDRSSGRKEVVSLGRYEDELVKHEGTWSFARRTAVAL